MTIQFRETLSSSITLRSWLTFRSLFAPFNPLRHTRTLIKLYASDPGDTDHRFGAEWRFWAAWLFKACWRFGATWHYGANWCFEIDSLFEAKKQGQITKLKQAYIIFQSLFLRLKFLFQFLWSCIYYIKHLCINNFYFYSCIVTKTECRLVL